MQVKKLKTEEKRRIAHEILDLVLDINGCDSRKKSLQGTSRLLFSNSADTLLVSRQK